MTRTEALELQEKLFPRKLMRVYDAKETPTNQWVEIPPTLCDICLDLRASCTGAADPWPREELLSVKDMLVARLATWRYKGNDCIIDELVRQMVQATVDIADSELQTRGW